MSVTASLALQEAVFAALAGSTELTALVGGRIFDAPPHRDAPDAVGGPYVTLGEERVEPWGAQGLSGGIHELEIVVEGSADGFAEAKRIAAAVAAAIENPPPLSEGRVATMRFSGSRARRTRNGGRRIELRFRFAIEL